MLGGALTVQAVEAWLATARRPCGYLPPAPLTVQAWLSANAAVHRGELVGWSADQLAGSSARDRLLYVKVIGQVGFRVAGVTSGIIFSAASCIDHRWRHALGGLGHAGLRAFVDGTLAAQNAAHHQLHPQLGRLRLLGPRQHHLRRCLGHPADDLHWQPRRGGHLEPPARRLEILQLYQRASNNARLQVRAYQQAGCADALAWLGSDGTFDAYFSELSDAAGSILLGFPCVALLLPAVQYF